MAWFWKEERGLSLLLLMLIVVEFILPPLLQVWVLARSIYNAGWTLLLVSGVAAVSHRKRVRYGVMAIALAAALSDWALSLSDATPLKWIDGLSSITTFLILSALVLKKVLREGPITRHRIQGAIAVYLLLGVAWAKGYEMIERLRPHAFAGAVDNAGWTYFSFVTLTTIGYGDITPVHPVARSMVIAEGLTGQLYLAIMISSLVSLAVQARTMNTGSQTGYKA